MNIGERIRLKRNEKGWSQRDLAEKMGYSNHSTIGKIETGKVDLPTSKVEQFAEVLGTSVAYLHGWEETQQKNSTLARLMARMRKDNEFLSVVEIISELSPEQLASIKQVATLMKG